jgi:hypothetical protein
LEEIPFQGIVNELSLPVKIFWGDILCDRVLGYYKTISKWKVVSRVGNHRKELPLREISTTLASEKLS